MPHSRNHPGFAPMRVRNVRLFLAFRIFFNARFYYPVFTILFLDFGLTLEQFALLNVAWAATIVLLEVPSGALADTVGRRNLVVAAGVFMVVEMAILCFAPVGKIALLFPLFLVNRILSGAAEAAASGADEALAYDSLCEEGHSGDWPRLLELQMRLQALAFVVSSTIGAALYDPALMQRLADALGVKATLTQETTLRFPLYLCLGMAVGALVTGLRMREPKAGGTRDQAGAESARIGFWESIRKSNRLVLQAAAWIWRTPFAFVLILVGILFDHVIRLFLTLNSQYYRIIDIPVPWFGVIGSVLSLMGFFMPTLARRLATTRTPRFNFMLLSVLTFLGLAGIAFAWPVMGLVPVALLFAVMFMTGFFLSHYLNRITDSRHRATVLSFRGLAVNLAYGFVGVLYGLLVRGLRAGVSARHPDASGDRLEDCVLEAALPWFPAWFVAVFATLVAFAWFKLRRSGEHLKCG